MAATAPHPELPSPEFPEPSAGGGPPPARNAGGRRRALARGARWAAGVIGTLLALVAIASFFVDEPLRRYMERSMNEGLHGYTVRIPKLVFHPLGASITLHGLTIVQNAHPDPPVAQFRALHASTDWRAALTGHLVADFRFVEPRIHVVRPQLQNEMNDPTPVKDEGWQHVLEAVYPFKINLLRIEDGDIVYIDEDPARPLHVAHLTVRADNIRNIHSKERTYPSPFHADGTIFETGRGSLDGNADFLAEPFAGVRARLALEKVPLDDLKPFGSRAHLALRGGTISTAGELEYGPRVRKLHLEDLELDRLTADYVHTAPGSADEKAQQETVKQAAKDAGKDPGLDLRLDRLHLSRSEIGPVNEARTPGYRVYLSSVSGTVENLSNGLRNGPAKAHLTCKFMKSGEARADAVFRPGKQADFDLNIAVEGTEMPAMNDLLLSYGKFDVVAGVFSLFVEMKVRNGTVEGYVKPIFRDMKVYDAEKDKGRSAGKKIYERLVDFAAKVLRNKSRHEVATKADLSGSIENPSSSTFQVATRLLQNAFFKAILPGFDAEVGKLSTGSRAAAR